MAGILSQADLDMVQREAAKTLLPELCTIQREAAASDGQGGQTYTWTNHATGVACHLSMASKVITQGGEQMTAAARVMQETRWLITLPAGTDLDQTDRIIITTMNRTFQVTEVVDQSWQLVSRALCAEIL